jgi:hypothetical protein
VPVSSSADLKRIRRGSLPPINQMIDSRRYSDQPWILIGGALIVAIVFALAESSRRRRGRDLGVISDQWLASAA